MAAEGRPAVRTGRRQKQQEQRRWLVIDGGRRWRRESRAGLDGVDQRCRRRSGWHGGGQKHGSGVAGLGELDGDDLEQRTWTGQVSDGVGGNSSCEDDG